MSGVEITLLAPENRHFLEEVVPGVFDRPLDPARVAEFLDDPRHHLAMAVLQGEVVGIASAVHYVHPDKGPELWINEVGVAPGHRGRGVGRRLVRQLLEQARQLDCTSAWTLTDEENTGARALYRSLGGLESRVAPVTVEFELAPPHA